MSKKDDTSTPWQRMSIEERLAVLRERAARGLPLTPPGDSEEDTEEPVAPPLPVAPTEHQHASDNLPVHPLPEPSTTPPTPRKVRRGAYKNPRKDAMLSGRVPAHQTQEPKILLGPALEARRHELTRQLIARGVITADKAH